MILDCRTGNLARQDASGVIPARIIPGLDRPPEGLWQSWLFSEVPERQHKTVSSYPMERAKESDDTINND